MGWYDLTSRQQKLDMEIENSGIELNSSNSCLKKVMRAIGATSGEEYYVKSRIALRLKTQALLDDTDNFINHTEKMLDDFKKDDEKWKREGRKLGFKFWD